MSKRGLVMSGGGSKGAFTLGVLVELAAAGLEYDFVSGVSVGALQAGMISQFPLGHFDKAVSALDGIWLGLKGDKDIYKRWFLGRLAGLINRESFYNSKPLREIIKANVTDARARKCGRTIRIGCCSYGRGMYWEAREDSPDLWKWISASSALAPFLAPVRINGDLWMDGGYRCVTPLKSAMEAKCDEIDVVLTGPAETGVEDPTDNWLGTKLNAYHVAMRCVGLMSDEVYLRDVEYAESINDLVDEGHPSAEGKRKVKLRMFVPEKKLGGGSLSFDPELLRKRREHGIKVAQKILSEGR